METMQQPKITGYRQLNETEAQLMNDIKALGKSIEGHIAMIDSHLRAQQMEAASANGSIEEQVRLGIAQPGRWVAIARTDFQTALMALTRAVAQPGSF